MLHLTNELALKLLILMEFARKVGMVGIGMTSSSNGLGTIK